MAYNADILLGTIIKVHGYEGTVTVKLEKAFTENIPEMKSVFLEIEGKPVPFFISESDYPGGNILRLKFDGYESIEKVAGFTGCKVFLTCGNNVISVSENIDELTGYMVYLPDNSLVGIVTEIINNSGQKLLIISSEKEKEILIPLHEDLVVKTDKNKHIIVMDLPDGLTDMN
jgi:16S rRNA processing protein RimM